MNTSPDPGRWLKELAEHSEVSDRRAPAEQLARLNHGLDQRRKRQHFLYWGGSLVAASIAVFVIWQPRFELASATRATTDSAAEWMDARARVRQHATAVRRGSSERVDVPDPPAEVAPIAPATEYPSPTEAPSKPTKPERPAKPATQASPKIVDSKSDRSPRIRRRGRPKQKQSRWRTLFAQGQIEEALDAMDPRTLETALARLSAQELFKLAQAARTQRDLNRARAILLRIRSRFSGLAPAGRATFLLGRVEHDLADDPTRSAHWFERYITEYADGPFVSQARGRLLGHYIKQNESERARRIASDYLKHTPNGPYAAISRSLLAKTAK